MIKRSNYHDYINVLRDHSLNSLPSKCRKQKTETPGFSLNILFLAIDGTDWLRLNKSYRRLKHIFKINLIFGTPGWQSQLSL